MERKRDMITISDILSTEQIDLNVTEADHVKAVYHVAALLKTNPNVIDWEVFYKGLKNSCVSPEEGDFAICIPHARTNSVKTMVMSVGRSAEGIVFPEADHKIHYIFAIGIPAALAAEYLRIIGALARIFRNPKMERQLRQVNDAAKFVSLISDMEMQLT